MDYLPVKPPDNWQHEQIVPRLSLLRRPLTIILIIAAGSCLCVVLLIAMWARLHRLTLPVESSTAQPATIDWESPSLKIEAFVMSQEFVKRRLKSPASATFPWYSEISVTHEGAGLFQVDAYVDAQNSFGATLRKSYVCSLRKVNEDWQLVSLRMSTP